jgi:methylthioribulose-1-phosphate dehydratase
MMTRQEALFVLADLKRALGQRGWLRATSGNLSVRCDDGVIAITASGTDKQRVVPDDVLYIDTESDPAWPTPVRPSAETAIHLAIYRRTESQTVIHCHTVFNNLAGEEADVVEFRDHEMLKALGHRDDDALLLPVLPNWGDLSRLAAEVDRRLSPAVPGILIRRHGVYAWGGTPADALRHLEALEFLFEWAYFRSLRLALDWTPTWVRDAVRG